MSLSGDPEGFDGVTVLVVDDEALGRDCVRLALEADSRFRLVGESPNAGAAIDAIRALDPDIVVLDIQMPDRSGFDVIREIGVDQMPVTVFVTAHDDFALQAFEVHAVDYVLKPFDDQRLVGALRRAARQLGRATGSDRYGGLMQQVNPGLEASRGTGYAKRLLVRADDRYRFVPVSEIDWVEAAGNNLRLHTRTDVHTIRMTMNDIGTQLDPTAFARIHRSTIVRIAAIKEIQPWFGGDYIAILLDGNKLRLSRTYREQVLRPFL